MSHLPRCFPGRLVLALAGGALALLAGCKTSDYTYTTRLADGQRLTFHMTEGRVEPGRAEGMETLIPRFEPDAKEHRLQIGFAFTIEGTPAIKHVRVEDMSEEKPIVLVDDANPQPKSGLWIGRTERFAADAPELHWVTYLDDSFKVYRFTVTLADGRTVVLHQGFMVARFMKAALRDVLAIKL